MRTKDFEASILWQVRDPERIVLEYQPGNGTRYIIMFVKIPDGACDGIGCMNGSWLVSLPDGAHYGHCAVLSSSGYLLPSYVAEKLHFEACNWDDVLVLTEIIGHVLGRQTPSALDVEAYRNWLIEHVQEG